MNHRAVSSVRELAGETGISKPSVVRILGILIEDGYVQRSSKHGCYILTENVLQLAAGFRRDLLLEQFAGPLMTQLTSQISWPTALGIFERGTMVVRYSTIPSSPLSWYRTTLHQKLPMLTSAMGLVFLAYSTKSTRLALIEGAPKDGISASELSEERFAQIRLRGFAIRTATIEHPTFSISVPILENEHVLGALSITLYARSITVDEAVTRFLETLRTTAESISAQSKSRNGSVC